MFFVNKILMKHIHTHTSSQIDICRQLEIVRIKLCGHLENFSNLIHSPYGGGAKILAYNHT